MTSRAALRPSGTGHAAPLPAPRARGQGAGSTHPRRQGTRTRRTHHSAALITGHPAAGTHHRQPHSAAPGNRPAPVSPAPETPGRCGPVPHQHPTPPPERTTTDERVALSPRPAPAAAWPSSPRKNPAGRHVADLTQHHADTSAGRAPPTRHPAHPEHSHSGHAAPQFPAPATEGYGVPGAPSLISSASTRHSTAGRPSPAATSPAYRHRNLATPAPITADTLQQTNQ